MPSNEKEWEQGIEEKRTVMEEERVLEIYRDVENRTEELEMNEDTLKDQVGIQKRNL